MVRKWHGRGTNTSGMTCGDGGGGAGEGNDEGGDEHVTHSFTATLVCTSQIAYYEHHSGIS